MDKNRENFRKVTAEADCGSMRGEKLCLGSMPAQRTCRLELTEHILARRLDGL